jgi:hypothetical protein
MSADSIGFSQRNVLYKCPRDAWVVLRTDLGDAEASATVHKNSAKIADSQGGKAVSISIQNCSNFLIVRLYEFNVEGAKQRGNCIEALFDHPFVNEFLVHKLSRHKCPKAGSSMVLAGHCMVGTPSTLAALVEDKPSSCSVFGTTVVPSSKEQ